MKPNAAEQPIPGTGKVWALTQLQTVTPHPQATKTKFHIWEKHLSKLPHQPHTRSSQLHGSILHEFSIWVGCIFGILLQLISDGGAAAPIYSGPYRPETNSNILECGIHIKMNECKIKIDRSMYHKMLLSSHMDTQWALWIVQRGLGLNEIFMRFCFESQGLLTECKGMHGWIVYLEPPKPATIPPATDQHRLVSGVHEKTGLPRSAFGCPELQDETWCCILQYYGFA